MLPHSFATQDLLEGCELAIDENLLRRGFPEHQRVRLATNTAFQLGFFAQPVNRLSGEVANEGRITLGHVPRQGSAS